MSLSVTLPLNVAETGPTFTFATACISLSLVFSRLWQPGMQTFSTSGSLSFAQTVSRSAGSSTSPFIVIAMRRLSQTCCVVPRPGDLFRSILLQKRACARGLRAEFHAAEISCACHRPTCLRQRQPYPRRQHVADRYHRQADFRTVDQPRASQPMLDRRGIGLGEEPSRQIEEPVPGGERPRLVAGKEPAAHQREAGGLDMRCGENATIGTLR